MARLKSNGKRTYELIGAPTSAGAHYPGQEKAPRFLRDAGLLDAIAKAGVTIVDGGDLPIARFRADRVQRQQQNLGRVVEVVQQIADRVEGSVRAGRIPIVLGGDCTICIGLVAGLARCRPDLALMYFDGHADLNTPANSTSGILDAMVVAHLIGEPGTAAELASLAPRMSPRDIALFAYNPPQLNAPELEAAERHDFIRRPLPSVLNDPAATAAETLAQLEARADTVAVHFDVDVIDFTDFPIANVPQLMPALPFDAAARCLKVFASGAKFGGLSISEINPDHMDEPEAIGARFNRAVAEALAG